MKSMKKTESIDPMDISMDTPIPDQPTPVATADKKIKEAAVASGAAPDLYLEDDTANAESPDKTLEELQAAAQGIVDNIAVWMNISPAPAVVLEGPTTKVKFLRTREGYKLECGLKAFMQPKFRVIIRLIHEMVHIYHDSEFMVDTCGNGAYHNDVFMKQISKYGIHCTWNRSYGFAGKVDFIADSVSHLPAALLSAFNDFVLPANSKLTNKAARVSTSEGGASRGFQPKIYKTVCPMCGEVFYTQKGVKCNPPVEVISGDILS